MAVSSDPFRNIVDPETAAVNRTGRRGGYTFHAPVPPDYEGVMLIVAALRLGDHAHLDINTGRAIPAPGNVFGRGTRGPAGRLILRWHEWEVLRAILEPHECVHIAEVENPTVGQLERHTGGRA